MCRARSLVNASAMLLACALASGIARAEAPPASAPSVDDAARRQQVIASGDGVLVTVGQVEDALAQQGPSAQARYRSPEALKALVDGLVRAELMADEAARRGYEQQGPVLQTAKDSAAQALVRAEVEEKITPQAIADADVQAYYEGHASEFHRTEMRRASQIVLESDDEAKRLWVEASKADARAFAELAKQHSKDPLTKPQGGDLGYFAREQADDGPLRDAAQPKVPPAVRKAVFALAEVGDTPSEPLVVDAQHVIVRFTADRPERHISLEDATLSIRAKLWRERRQKALEDLYAQLRAKDKPQVFTDRIYQISFDDMEKRPGGFSPDPAPAAAQSPKGPSGTPPSPQPKP